MTVITLAGCYGSGTQTAADIMAEHYEDEFGETTVSTDIRDYIKARYRIVHGHSTANWKAYREWAESVRGKYDDGVFASRLAETWNCSESPNIVISGLNCPKQIQNLNWYFGSSGNQQIADSDDSASFGDVHNVSMWTLPDVRYERLHGEKPSTDDKQWPLFKDRNDYELNVREMPELFCTEQLYDYVLQNNGSKDILEERAKRIVKAVATDDTCYLTNNPFPVQEPAHVRQYL